MSEVTIKIVIEFNLSEETQQFVWDLLNEADAVFNNKEEEDENVETKDEELSDR